MLEIFGLLADSSGTPLTGDKKYTFAKQFPIRRNEAQLQSLMKMKSVSANASAEGIKPGGIYTDSHNSAASNRPAVRFKDEYQDGIGPTILKSRSSPGTSHAKKTVFFLRSS